jgi:hypothetical protein
MKLAKEARKFGSGLQFNLSPEHSDAPTTTVTIANDLIISKSLVHSFKFIRSQLDVSGCKVLQDVRHFPAKRINISIGR